MSRDDRACILRYATGISLCLALSLGIGWTLSNLAPMLAAAFLGNRNPAPAARQMIGILLAIAIIFGLGLGATLFLYPYPAVFLLLFCWALFLNFYAGAMGAPGFVVLLYTMAILLLPLLGGPQPAMAMSVAQGFMISSIAALAVTRFVHLLFPGGTQLAEKQALETAPRDAVVSAWLSCAVILPFALVCLVFNLTGAILPLIMIAILSQKPDFSAGAAGGKALLAANIGGGLVAMAFFQFLRASPTLAFAVSGFLLLGLLFGRQVFSDKPTAPLYSSAFNTVIILVGSATGIMSEGASSEFYSRILLIGIAVIYVIGALSLLEASHARERWMRAGRWISRVIARTGTQRT